MREPRPARPSARSPRLLERSYGDRTELWTETVGEPPAVYGERWTEVGGRTLREFDPHRAKLSAALVRGWEGPLPGVGERWLYLGAASGTTASHVADLVGPSGRVYAVERSVRPFAQLLALSERWPNLLPVLADARELESFADLVPPVDGVYSDIAQPDQVEILRAAAEAFLWSGRGSILLALKASSIGRESTPASHAARAEEGLGATFDLAPMVKLDPFHRAHFLIGGSRGGGPPVRTSVRPRPARSRAR